MKYLIDDVRAGEEAVVLSSFGLTVVRAEEMTESLLADPFWSLRDPQQTLLVFPGNGANILRQYLPQSWLERWEWRSVPAKRFWIPGEDPWVSTGRIFSSGFILGKKDLVIMDDVVSSGQTIRSVHKGNSSWIPGVTWHACAWLAQCSASWRGFASLTAAVWTGNRQTREPINSLSTLLADKEICNSFAVRNLSDPQSFLTLMEKWRSQG